MLDFVAGCLVLMTIFVGSVVFAVLLFTAVTFMLRVVRRVLPDDRDPIRQPEDVVERLGGLTQGQVFTDTVQRRAEAKRRLHMLPTKERGRARLGV